jgi:hypothetical protein
MCTVTVVGRQDGLRLVCNRDEQIGRPAALSPRFALIEGARVLYPVDPPSAGTWIAVNDKGLCFALLNRSTGRGFQSLVPTRYSRGIIIPQLLGCADRESANIRAMNLDPRAFEPFCLLIVDRISFSVVESDGSGLSPHAPRPIEPRVFTSSSLGDGLVAKPRQDLFDALLAHHGGDALRAQSDFHRHQWSDRRDLSVLMEREDARTVSRTTVDIQRRTVAMDYEALPSRTRSLERAA